MSILQGSGYTASVAPASGSTNSITASLTATAPDGTTSTPTVTTAATEFTATITAAQVGNYLLVWTLTGTSVQVIQDQFTVEAAGLTLSNLAQVRAEMNKGNDHSADTKIRQWLRDATAVIENITGPILPRTKTYVTNGGGTYLVLPNRWVKSVTSITESLGGVNYPLTEQPLGSSTSSYGYTWQRGLNKIIRRDASGSPYSFASGDSNVTVVYVAGMDAIPDPIQRASSQMILHWYNKDSQPVGSGFSRTSDDYPTTMVGTYEVPNAVLEVVMPYANFSGFA